MKNIDKATKKAKLEIDFLTKKGYNIDVYSTLNRDAVFGGEKIEEFIIATQGSIGKGKDTKFAIAYWYTNDEDGEVQINTKLLNEISESFKGHPVTLYTNAGIDLHSKTKGEYKNVKVVKVPYGEFSGNSDEYAKGGGVEKMKKGARLDTNWVGNKTKENWGKNNLYEMYSNNLDLCADLHDYFKQLLEDTDENYTNEMKNNLIEVLKTGNLKGRSGKENLKFAQGGATKGFNYSIGGL